jgi:hypothetical protein
VSGNRRYVTYAQTGFVLRHACCSLLAMVGTNSAVRGELERAGSASRKQYQATLQDLVLGPEEAQRLRETGLRSPFTMVPARAACGSMAHI